MTTRIAVPSKGRLQEGTLVALRDAGLQFESTDRALSVPVRNADMELLFVRTEDIPELVADRVADLGITGQDLLAEFDGGLTELVELGYGRCRLAAAVPRDDAAEKLEDLAGRRLATSHPNTTRTVLAERGIDATVVPLRGSVEVAPKLGVADAVVDLVSSEPVPGAAGVNLEGNDTLTTTGHSVSARGVVDGWWDGVALEVLAPSLRGVAYRQDGVFAPHRVNPVEGGLGTANPTDADEAAVPPATEEHELVRSEKLIADLAGDEEGVRLRLDVELDR